MSNYQTILVVADPDPEQSRPLDLAKFLAGKLGARLLVAGFAPEAQRDPTFERRFTKTVDQALGDFGDYEITLENDTDMAARIIDLCTSGSIDLVIKTGHRSETVFYSPIDWHLIRDIKTPVLLLDGGKSHRKLKTIMATVDPEDVTAEQKALDRKVLDASADMAARLGSTLHGAVCVKTSQVLTDLDLVDIHKREHAHAPAVHKIIDTELGQYDIKPDNWHVHAGAPEKVLAGIARGIDADLVVIGTVGRKRLQGLLIGNTAEKILRMTHTNVLVIKPD